VFEGVLLSTLDESTPPKIPDALFDFLQTYGPVDKTSADVVSDSFGLTLWPRIDCVGKSGAKENVMAASL